MFNYTSAKNMQTNNFLKWYNENFSRGEVVANHLAIEISNTAAEIGVDWSGVSDRVSWRKGKEGKVNAYGSSLLKGFKNSVGIYASLETCSKTGVEYPLITFKNKGGAGDTVVFNALSYLWDLYKEQIGKPLSPAEINKRESEKRAKAETAARKQQAALLKQQQENKRRAANVSKELVEHNQLPRAVSFVYTDNKKIANILNYVDARQGQDKHGQFISLQLHDTLNRPRGLQRIYNKNITKPDGSKTNKDFTWGMNKDGAHLVIGDIANADRVFVVEGFATGASVFLAMLTNNKTDKVAVIVALDSGNMVKVVDQYKKEQPHLVLHYALDNDQHKCKQGKGNAGVLVGINLLAKHKDDRAFLPNFELVDNVFQATDWNDLHEYRGLKEVAKQLNGNKSRFKLAGDLFERALDKLQYVSNTQLMKEALVAANVGMQVGLPKYRPSDVVNLIRTHTAHAKDRINVKQLNEKVTKIFKAKVHAAQEFRSFSKRITSAKFRPEHITYKRFNSSVVTDEMLNYVKSKAGDIVIVRAPMGSGKTQNLIKPVMWENERSAFFAHRVSLIGGAWDALSKNMPSGYAPITHYQDPNVKDMLPGSNKLACCINSAIKGTFAPLVNNLHALCIDEAAQTLRHTTAGSAVAYPVAVFNKILQMVSTTRDHIVLADADANDTLVEFCELALKRRNAYLKELYGEDHPDCKIHVVDAVTDCSNTKIYYTNADTAFLRAEKDVAAGFKVLIANDSAKNGAMLYTHLQNNYPDKKGLFIDADSKPEKNIQAFTDDPNGESVKYDYVIYSPAISSGVSIENGHFNRHYGIFCGTVAPSDAIQMIRRDRKATEFILGLSTLNSSREESALNMWLGMVLANEHSQLDVAINKETSKIELTTEDLEFDRFRLELIAQENKAKNDFANNLLCILFADGYKLHQLEATELEQEIGKSKKEASRDLLKEIDMQRHLENPTPSDTERAQLNERNNLSKDEKAQLNRWAIENQLMMDVDQESIEFFNKGALRKVKLFELLQMSADDAKRIDNAELSAEVHPSTRLYLAKQRQALRDFFEIAGIDSKTGKGSATPENLVKAMNHLIEGDNIHVFNSFYKFGGHVDTFSRRMNPLNKAKGIMQALGLTLNKTQLASVKEGSTSRLRYSIEQADWAFMANIHQKRLAKKVSGYSLEHLEGITIHTIPDNYIDNTDAMDAPQATKIKASSWIGAFKQAAENLKIPLEFAPKVMVKLREEGHMSQSTPPEGVQSVISRIYNGLVGQFRPHRA